MLDIFKYLDTLDKNTKISNEEQFSNLLKSLKFYGEDTSSTEVQKQSINQYKIILRGELYRSNMIKKFDEIEFKYISRKGLFSIYSEDIENTIQNIDRTTIKLKILKTEKQKYQEWKRIFLRRILLLAKEENRNYISTGFFSKLYEQVKGLDMLIKEEIKPFTSEITKTNKIKKELEIELLEMKRGSNNGSTKQESTN